MSSILDHDFISIKQATKEIKTRPHIATIGRWADRGCRGHKLETWLVGGQRFTTRAAIEDFLSKINSKPGSVSSSPSKSRQRAIESAEKELAELGL